jgi:hypothetical protein
MHGSFDIDMQLGNRGICFKFLRRAEALNRRR